MWSSSDESSSDELEVLAPLANRNRQEGPRLSSTGEHPSDAIEVLKSDDSSDDDVDDLPLSERLIHHKKPRGEPSISRPSEVNQKTQPLNMGSSEGRKPSSQLLLSDSDDDSSLEDLLRPTAASKKRTAAPTEKRKETKRLNEKPKAKRKNDTEEKLAEKERAKQERAKARKEAKEAKATEAERKKAEKHKAKIALDQTRGKFSQLEVACLIDSAWFQKNQEILRSATAITHEHRHLLNCKAIQWIRRDYTEGGAAAAHSSLIKDKSSGYSRIPIVAIILTGTEFLELLARESEEDDYPQLGQWATGVLESYKIAWKTSEPPRMILLLHEAKKELELRWKTRSKQDRPPTDHELEDALTWILIQYQVETIHCIDQDKKNDSIIHELDKMSRLLGEEPYQQPVSELECIKKLKANSGNPVNVDTWFRQVQQIPRVSSTSARNLTQYYPTAASLWEAYQNPDFSEEERQSLVANCFHENRSHFKLSQWIYRVMTSDNPTELLV